jgi:CDP-diacylglycerol--glycerol-3-phosphate 3-phosphatidyltransferase
MTNSSAYRSVAWLPNAITMLRIFAGIMLFTVIFYDKKITGWRIACFLLVALTDWVDGWLARRMNARTLWGQLLDPLADKVVLLYAFAYFCYTGYASSWFTIVYFAREIAQSAMRISFFVQKEHKQSPTLFVSKIKTALSYLYGLLLFGEQWNPALLANTGRLWMHAGFEWLIIILSFTGFVKPFIKKWNLHAGKK